MKNVNVERGDVLEVSGGKMVTRNRAGASKERHIRARIH